MTSGKYRRRDHPNSDPRKLKRMRQERAEKNAAREARIFRQANEPEEDQDQWLISSR